PPRFSNHQHNVSVGSGGHAVLRCPATGDQPMKLSWHKDGRLITPSESYRHELRESTVGGVGGLGRMVDKEQVLELVVRGITRDDGGEYLCTAENKHGHVSTTVMLLVQDVHEDASDINTNFSSSEAPDLPRSLHILDKGSRHVRLAWEAPQDGNSPITKYTLRYSRLGDWQQQIQKTQHEEGAGEELSVGGQETEARVESLMPATQYLFTLFAHNAMGSSKPSE
ncbi:hypothetical protein SK128_009901, partial [Halocaridina rubra]